MLCMAYYPGLSKPLAIHFLVEQQTQSKPTLLVKDKVELGGAVVGVAHAVDQLFKVYQGEKHHGEHTSEHVAKPPSPVLL
jgi:hypothetical protein